jgi:mono/diheme cytochrome c family protein
MMAPKWKWGLVALGAVAVAITAGVVIFLRSQAVLDARSPKPPSDLQAATAPAAIAEGRRLTVVVGCVICHGGDLTGRRPGVAGSPVAPNLTLLVRRLSDADVDRAIRRGMKPDGSSELAMPSFAYAALTDQEAGAIVGYLRSLAPQGTEAPQPRPSWLLRADLAAGVVKTSPDRLRDARPPLDAGPAFEPGRHLAQVACGQCHGRDLAAGRRLPGPDLTIRGYYNRAQFRVLLRTGEGTGPQEMELMSRVATLSLSHLSDSEIDAIFDYLDARDRILGAAPAH